jgi:AcrR family transcriptional regulator
MPPLGSGRAAPLSPDDRRAAILASAIPLLRERGTNVTTRALAQAAGVAEGTLFRVFPDKDALVHAALAEALDPAPLVAELAAIDPAADLRTALTEAVGLLVERGRDVAALLSAWHGTSREAGHRGHHPHHGPPRDEGHPVARVTVAVTALLERYATELRRPPDTCARLLVGLVLTTSRSAFFGGAPGLHPDELVGLFLDGALAPLPSKESSC